MMPNEAQSHYSPGTSTLWKLSNRRCEDFFNNPCTVCNFSGSVGRQLETPQQLVARRFCARLHARISKHLPTPASIDTDISQKRHEEFRTNYKETIIDPPTHATYLLEDLQTFQLFHDDLGLNGSGFHPVAWTNIIDEFLTLTCMTHRSTSCDIMNFR